MVRSLEVRGEGRVAMGDAFPRPSIARRRSSTLYMSVSVSVGVAFLLALAVCVEPLGNGADTRLLGCAGHREGEFLEAGCLDVDPIVANA